MADVTRLILPASMFYGDGDTLITAGDIAATLDVQATKAVVKFIDGAAESVAVSQHFVMPSIYAGGNIAVKLFYFGDAAPGANNGVDWEVAFEAVTESDAFDLQGVNGDFAAAQAVTDTIDANAGELNVASITFTQAQADAVAAGDLVRIAVRRDSDDAADTYADSVWLAAVEIMEAVA